MSVSKAQIVTRMFRRVVGSSRLWTPLLSGGFCLWIAPPAGMLHWLAYLGWGLGGLAAYRVIKQVTVNRRQLLADSLDDICRAQQSKHASELRRLLPVIRKDKDPRTNRILKELERVHERLLRIESEGIQANIRGLPLLLVQANELYTSCLDSLKRSVQLWVGAREMATTEARDRLLAERDQTVADVEQSIQHLDASLDHLQTAAIKVNVADNTNHAQLRDELQLGLDVARQVEVRIDAIEQGYDIGTGEELE